MLGNFLASMLKKSARFMLKSFIKLVTRFLMILIYKINLPYKILGTVLIKDDSPFLAIKIPKKFHLH